MFGPVVGPRIELPSPVAKCVLYPLNHLLNSPALHGSPVFLMPFSCGLRALRPVCAGALFLGAAGLAHAIGPDAPDEGALELDLAIQALKDEVVQFNRDAQLAEETHLYPPETRLSVYISTSVPHLLLSEVSVSVDDGAPVQYRYRDRDARALHSGDALQRLLRLNVARGAHRIQVQYAGELAEARKEPIPVSGSFTGDFEKGIEPAELELRVVRGSGRKDVDMKLRQWKVVE